MGIGDSIALSDDGNVVGVALVDQSGTWALPLSGLSDGLHVLTAVDTDVAGDASATSPALNLHIVTSTAAPGALALAQASDTGFSNSDRITKVTTPTISGTGVDGDVVTLRDGATIVGSATVAAGAWAITTTSLAAATHTLTSTETDVAGNVSVVSTGLTLTIDSTIPVATSTPVLDHASDSGAPGANTHQSYQPADHRHRHHRRPGYAA